VDFGLVSANLLSLDGCEIEREENDRRVHCRPRNY
jgi:hypothetical protein